MEILDEASALLDQSSGVIGLLECIEISHPKWDEVYRFVVNSNESVVLTHEDGSSHLYEYAPITISRSADAETLEQELNFVFADLGDTIPRLIDTFIDDEAIDLPVLSYRAYIIGSYENPIFVARGLEIETINRDWQGTRAGAKAPSLNDSGNGEVYNASTDPSLIGFY